MFRNYFSAAWGDLARSPVQSLIAIGGLAIGLTAAILAGIVAMNQFSYDDFIPGHERLYYAVFDMHGVGGERSISETPHDLAAMLQQNFSQIEAVTRISDDDVVLSHGTVMAKAKIYWADANFFRLVPIPVLYGDLNSALARPDGIVIPLATARQYFGRDNVVGESLELDHAHVMTVRAVIEDLPLNSTNLSRGIFVSSLASFSGMAERAGQPGMSMDGILIFDVTTLVQLKPGASLNDLTRGATNLVAKFVPRGAPNKRSMHFERLDQLHLSPKVYPAARPRLLILAAAALAILVLACANFVNLSTARSSQRGVEVAIRKVSGAGRGALVVQFLGETILQVLFALFLAVALVEWLLPGVNAFLDAGAVFDYWREPALIAAMVTGAVLVGILAGAYPALILSGFRPAAALKGWTRSSAAGGLVRQCLVTLQFAVLIVLLIAAIVVYRQNGFATTEALRVNTDQMLLVNMKACDEGFRVRIVKLPGVRTAICSSLAELPSRTRQIRQVEPRHPGALELQQGKVLMTMMPVNFGFFELYGVKPIAGRLLRPQSGDQIPQNPAADQKVHFVINDTARRQLGYATPLAAVGEPLTNANTRHQALLKPGEPPRSVALDGTIVGVVRDFSLTPYIGGPSTTDDEPFPATAYSAGQAQTNVPPPPMVMNVRLNGRAIPETLAAIDAAWKQSGEADPMDRVFLDAYVQQLEIAVLRQGQAFATFAAVALLLACLGLFGVSLSTTARRIREIGVRKAMGARNDEIVALLLWQFSKPVLWANFIAWLLAWWAMRRWLDGFAYHVPLSWWLFPLAGAATLLIALVTVAGQAWLVARRAPVTALRYE